MSNSLFKKKILTLILAGGKGGRMGLLTDERAKPVLPFAGNYRLIDFALSNCLHSGLTDVWVVEQYKLHSLNEHLANGRPWDLDRTFGGLQILPPFEGDEKKATDGGFAEGNADAIVRQLELIKEFNPDILISLSADHLYTFDFRDALQSHIDNDAALTMVTVKLPPGENASRFGVVKTGKNGSVTRFDYKPEKPESDIVTTEIFIYNGKELMQSLAHLIKQKGGVKDYGHELVPHFVENKKAFEYRHTGYWRDVGTIESYWKSHMELLEQSRKKLVIDDENWRILTRAKSNIPAFISDSANITDSLIADGAKIYGAVKKSVLSAGVVIEKGAEIEECVVLPDAVIEKGVKLKRAVIDSGAKVSAKRLTDIKRGKKDIIVIGKRKIQTEEEIMEEYK